ncbi:MAG: hypothetical protein EXR45_08930 [Chloroflexi bacterium]|nr:hypothetical protein [Chloroflexota bacterium]
MRRTHLGYYRALAKRCEPLVVGREQVRWMGVMRAELENIRSALEWGLGETRDGEGAEARTERVTWASELCHAFRQVFGDHGRSNERSHWAKRSMAWIDPANVEGASPGLEPTVVVDPRLLARIRCGYATDQSVETSLRRRLLEAVRDTCDALGDHAGAGMAWTGLWLVPTTATGFDVRFRLTCGREAAVRYRKTGDVRGLIWSLGLVGTYAVWIGEVAEGTAARQEALAIATEHGDVSMIATLTIAAAFEARRRGDFNEALRGIDNSHGWNQSLGRPRTYWNFAGMDETWCLIATGDHPGALVAIDGQAREARRRGPRQWIDAATWRRGDLARAQSDLDAARSHYAAVPADWVFNPPLWLAQVEAMAGNIPRTVDLLIQAVARYRVRFAEHWADDADVAGEVAACIAEADPVTALRVGGFASAMRTSGRADHAYPFDQARIDKRLAVARSLVTTGVAGASWQAGSGLGAEEAYAEAEAALRVMADGLALEPETGQ